MAGRRSNIQHASALIDTKRDDLQSLVTVYVDDARLLVGIDERDPTKHSRSKRTRLRGSNTPIPSYFEAEFEGNAVPYGMTMAIAVHEGSPTIVGLTIRRRRLDGNVVQSSRMKHPAMTITSNDFDITTNGLRKIAVPFLLKVATLVAADYAKNGERGSAEVRLSELEQSLQSEPVPRATVLDDDHYRDVARTYREAVDFGRNPTEAVAEKHSAARSTAGRWVGEARKRGFLGPTRRGRAGEIDEEGDGR